MTVASPPAQVKPTTPTPPTKSSFIERLLRLYPIQGNHHLPPPPPSTSPAQDATPRHPPVDVRVLETFLSPIGRPRRAASIPTPSAAGRNTGDIESQFQSNTNE
ncbi:hypothetical protein I302_102411 [Kwoniella bestiolae CBS 10118]|uniref:Uncharacterized protein n=1 Tax=Kwoniella bestiolae CBS 10118 TaxID=1296100 RepID=A0A1B9GET5_9TREE|nr:hypothetical protein I302_01101 [Kwoniella bestiolae CBS 10118]OCF29592.1 hypothetical protein I302_01101 [Kwoniella bestiolae CBS 10118]